MCEYLPPVSTMARCKSGCEKCGYLADVGKARTSTRCVTPSLDSSPRNCSSDRVECPIVKSLAGSTLHEAPSLYTRRTRWRSNSGGSRLMQRLPAEENSCRPHIVSHVDEQQGQVATAPQQACQHYDSAHLAEQRRDRSRSLSD